jgi:uncharacterized protein with HEPN domain
MTNDESRLRLAAYLSHMLEAARLAREYVEDSVKADFLNDRRTQQAVVLNLITIGEAAPRIVSGYGDIAAAHSANPWAPESISFPTTGTILDGTRWRA